MIPDFLLIAGVAGIGVAVMAAPLGCFVVWRRMAYFGDSLAHSALLGVALGLALGIGATAGIAVAAIAMALLLVLLQRQKRLASDTLLGIMAHSGLAAGVIAVSFFADLRLDLFAYLFGDILAVGALDLALIWGAAALSLAVLWAIWSRLLLVSLHEELATAEGLPVLALRLLFMVMIALVIATAMKVVGILLITSLLIIPAATARRFARAPEAMAAIAAAIGSLSVILGLGGSYLFDTPSGPSIVAAAGLIFAASQVSGFMPAPAPPRRS